ncbi:MAG: hypothetical protein MPJ22_00295 [Pirellulales bacterium]|nr:hypothetical protein [Pirellulales bacterium]
MASKKEPSKAKPIKKKPKKKLERPKDDRKQAKTCPKCGVEVSTVDQLHAVFGVRMVRGKEVPQSYCRECRKNKSKKKTDPIENAAPAKPVAKKKKIAKKKPSTKRIKQAKPGAPL